MPPTLAVGFISPESRTRDRRDKLREYADAGVLEYWLIDAEREKAEFYRLDEDGVFVIIPLVEETRFESVVLVGFWLEVAWLWADPSPKLATVLASWKEASPLSS